MKRLSIIFLLVIFLLAPTLCQAQLTQGRNTFSLEESVSYALEHNLLLQNRAFIKSTTEADIRRGLSDIYPNIQGQIEYDYNFALRQNILPDFISPSVYRVLEAERLVNPAVRNFNVFPATFGTTHTGSATIRVSQKLLDINYMLSLKLLPLVRQESEAQYQLAQDELIANVHRSYYNVLISEKQYTLANENTQRLTRLLQETNIMYNNGFAEKIDLKRLEVSLNKAKIEQTNIANQQKNAKRLLNFMLSIEIETPISASDSLGEDLLAVREQQLSTAGEGEDFIASHPKYKVSKVSEEQALMTWQSEKFTRIPTIDLRGNVGYNMGANDGGDIFAADSWFLFGAVGATMKVPILQGFKINSAIQKNKLHYLSAQNNTQNVYQELLQGRLVEQANYEQAKSTYQVQQANEALAQEVYNIAREKYQQGVGSSLELLDAALAYRQAQTERYFALHQALVALSNYQKSLGDL